MTSARLARLESFQEIWLADFEFRSLPGERPTPICLVAYEMRSRREVRLWGDELRARARPPYPTDRSALFISFYLSAEAGCHLALGWPLPESAIDLYAEFRCHTNGRETPCGAGLLGALAYFGLNPLPAGAKDSMRQLALRGEPFTTDEQKALLEYCASDVTSLLRLLHKMSPGLDVPRALLRGRYMLAAARMERIGVPLDMARLSDLKEHWQVIHERLIRRLDRSFGVYERRTFREPRFEAYLARKGIPWPRHTSGRLRLDDETFREQTRAFPILRPLKQLRSHLSQMRLHDLAVGSDGRNRCLLSAFRSRTGRNQPSNSRFIFGVSSWMRGLIRPSEGRALAYIDWSMQEFGIAAALSGDPAMAKAYRSGDPYLTFAKQAGAAPSHATAESHADVRKEFKAVTLAVQYGMSPQGLGQQIRCGSLRARQLLDLHRRTYPVFWRWSDAAVDVAMLRGCQHTVFGWPIHIGTSFNHRSLRNFPMQANGAEMLRLACCLATEAGIHVCAPVHDAILVEAPVEDLDAVVHSTQLAMAEASRAVLSGFELAIDVRRVVHPERYLDERGEQLWNLVMQTLVEAKEGAVASRASLEEYHGEEK